MKISSPIYLYKIPDVIILQLSHFTYQFSATPAAIFTIVITAFSIT
jgi:hypothetical protein